MISARESHGLVTTAIKQGMDINEGIVVYYKQQFYHEKNAVNLLNLLADKSTFREKLSQLLYKNNVAVFLGYPFLKILRNFNLALHRKPKIQNQEVPPILLSLSLKTLWI